MPLAKAKESAKPGSSVQEAISRSIQATGWQVPSWAQTMDKVKLNFGAYDIFFSRLAKRLKGVRLEDHLVESITEPIFRAP